MTRPRLLPVLEDLVPYRAGPIRPSAAGRVHRLGANESPHDPLPGVLEAVRAAAGSINRYPDPGAAGLVADIARTHGVAEDQVLPGAGSGALLQLLTQVVAGAEAEMLYAWRSFELYPVFADLAGLRSVRVPLRGRTHDLGRMADRLTDRTRLVIVCNPNNPTGTLLGPAELAAFLDRVPADCLVAVDEAYVEYARDPAVHSALRWCRERPNLVVLRTFSKAYGLAGLRAGYLVGDPGLVARLRKACLPYAVSDLAQAAARAALGMRDQMLLRVGAVAAERTRVRRALRAAGWDPPDSQANFLWVPLGEASAPFGRWCGDRGVAVRTFPGEGIRVSIGSPRDNDAFLSATAGWRRRAGAGIAAPPGPLLLEEGVR